MKIHVQLNNANPHVQAMQIYANGGGEICDIEVLDYLIAICRKNGDELTAHRIDKDINDEDLRIDYDWKEIQDARNNNLEVRCWDDEDLEASLALFCPGHEQ